MIEILTHIKQVVCSFQLGNNHPAVLFETNPISITKDQILFFFYFGYSEGIISSSGLYSRFIQLQQVRFYYFFKSVQKVKIDASNMKTYTTGSFFWGGMQL